MGNRSSSVLTGLWILSLVISLPLNLCAQTKERPKLKDFGSSLKRTHWDTDKQQAIVDKPTSRANDDDADVVKVETSLVTSDVLVLDAHGKPVDGLTEEDFLINEDGVPQKVGMFALGTNQTVARTIVLIIDYSGSQLPFIKTSIAAAKSMIDKLGPLDRVAIVDDDVEMIQDFTTDKKKLKDKLQSLLSRTKPIFGGRRLGKSQQYSALFATLNEAFDNEDQRPIVVFQTDGDELGTLRNSPLSQLKPPPQPLPMAPDPKMQQRVQQMIEQRRASFSLEDIYRAAEKSRATIYTVFPGYRLTGLTRDEQMKQMDADSKRRFSHDPPDLLRRPEWQEFNLQSHLVVQNALAAVSTVSGGWLAFLESPDQADAIYSSIFSDINRRYVVGYYPTNKKHDGKRRKIAVTIRNHRDYEVIGRAWYYAPEPDW